MDSHGAISIEYIIVFLTLLLVLTAIISITIQEASNIEETQNRNEARMVSSHISWIINSVLNSPDGYSDTYTLPAMINKETYIVQINSTGVYVNSHYQLTNNDILAKNNLKSRNYILTPSNTYEFSNNNGTIEINQVN